MSFHQHLQELFGISKFMLFLADQLSEEEYEALLQLQLDYYDYVTYDSAES
ncbi:MAG: hypothetical protein NWE83_01615 [Candidatus Bathyarchaeota archaeon]|jgi:hypothetical protein|nr:hypothetical protein [Candidatus Bathyarchaeota archaeon]